MKKKLLSALPATACGSVMLMAQPPAGPLAAPPPPGAPAPPPADSPDVRASYAASGVVRSLNSDRDGEVNGFLLRSGVIALTPPNAANVPIKVGTVVVIAGKARVTRSGRTVVDVQTLTANDRSVAMRATPPPAPPARPAGLAR